MIRLLLMMIWIPLIGRWRLGFLGDRWERGDGEVWSVVAFSCRGGGR